MQKLVYLTLDITSGQVDWECHLPQVPLTKDGITVFHIGSFYQDRSVCSNADLEALYCIHGESFYTLLDGIGIVFVVDRNRRKLLVETDLFNSSMPLYLYKTGSRLVFSNQLKEIILRNQDTFSFNDDAVAQFLAKGFVVGKDTLVREIEKIPGKHNLAVDFDGQYAFVPQLPACRIYQKSDVTPEKYNQAVDGLARTLLRGKIGIPLTSGYDTNLLLYHLRQSKAQDQPLQAFCVGGAIGWNEIGISRQIADYYGDVELATALVDGETFACYPEIVRILEGAVYEHGIFLQYALANLARQSKIDRIILGECADQIMDYELWYPDEADYLAARAEKDAQARHMMEESQTAIIPYRDIYEIGTCKIIKKSGIMLNHYGIETEYPYLRRAFCSLAMSVMQKGDRKKTYHKQVVCQTVAQPIAEHLSKKPGATELRTLFIGDVTYDDLVSFARKSSYYRPLNFNDEIYQIHYSMKLAYLELFRRIFLQPENRAWLSGEQRTPPLCEFLEKS